MKITFDSAAMTRQLAAASRVLNNKNSFPVLDCYLFEVAEDGSHVAITASDSENTLRITCPLVAFEPDADASKRRICVKARLIIDALKEIPAQPVTLTINMQTMEIRGDYANGHFAIVGERADEYPVPPTVDDDATRLAMPAAALLASINATAYATADDEIRPVMNGIYFDLTPEHMVCVGTDGKILVRRTVAATMPDLELPAFPAGFILPKKTAVILRTLLPKDDAAVALRFTDRQLCVEGSAFTLVARLIDGRYPNYNSVIPQNNPYTADVTRDDLMSAIRRVSAFASENTGLLRLQFSSSQLAVSAQDLDYSTSAQEVMPAGWNGPDGFAIGLKGALLYTLLQNLGSDPRMALSDPGRAVLIAPAESPEHTDTLMLIMPMALI